LSFNTFTVFLYLSYISFDFLPNMSSFSLGNLSDKTKCAFGEV
jgi:hypothetical protein